MLHEAEDSTPTGGPPSGQRNLAAGLTKVEVRLPEASTVAPDRSQLRSRQRPGRTSYTVTGCRGNSGGSLAISSLTAFALAWSEALSSSVRAISKTFSIPLRPSWTGTPT